jgi:hypothetical protein
MVNIRKLNHLLDSVKISEEFRWHVLGILCWWSPGQRLSLMPPTKPNLVCFMAQKMILVRETGFVNA